MANSDKISTAARGAADPKQPRRQIENFRGVMALLLAKIFPKVLWEVIPSWRATLEMIVPNTLIRFRSHGLEGELGMGYSSIKDRKGQPV